MPLNRANQPNQLKHKAINPQKALPYIIHFVLCPVYSDFFKINKMYVSSNIEIEVDGEKRSFDSYTKFLLAKLHGYNQSIVCISVE